MRFALQYNVAKLTVDTSMYKTKIDKLKPCINFCNLWLNTILKFAHAFPMEKPFKYTPLKSMSQQICG